MTLELGSGIDIFLHPGECYFGDRHCRILTTLGSCVALTLWHPELKLGGMCHYLLPGAAALGSPLNGRYAQDAVQLLFEEIAAHGVPAQTYQCKMFGGANMFVGDSLKNSVAQRNIQAAEDLVRIHKLPLVARDTGGRVHRQLCFDLASGDVWVRHGCSGTVSDLAIGSL